MDHDATAPATKQDLRDLASALEAVISALLIGERDPETVNTLIRSAHAMAAAIARGDPIPGAPPERPDA
jgi:hypothetical protein